MTDKTTFTILPLTLSMGTLGGRAAALVRRGTPLPARRTQHCSTTADNQKTVSIEVYLGESPIANKNIFVAKCELNEIPEAPKGDPVIDVTFEVDQQCRIRVTAKEKKSGKTISSEVEEAPTHLTREKVDEMLLKANEARQEDETAAQQIDARNKAAYVIDRAEKYLQNQQKSGFVNAADEQVEETLASLGLSIQDDNIGAIKDKTNRLEQLIPATTFGSLADLFGGNLGSNIFGDIFPPPTGGLKTQANETATKAKTTSRSNPKKKSSEPEEVTENKKGIFSTGQYFDAKNVVRGLFAQATHEIVIIDAYVGEDVLNLLTVKREGVAVKLLTGKIAPALLTLAKDFNRQYKDLEIRSSKAFHDRFVIIDDKDFYHFGASLEHLGNKTFMFSQIEELSMISALKKQWQEAWSQATQTV